MKQKIEAESLVRQGRFAVTDNRLSDAIPLFVKAASIYEKYGDRPNQMWALGAAGYLSFLVKDVIQGLSLMKNASELGYHDLTKLEQLGAMRHEGRLVSQLKSFRKIADRVRRNAAPIEIVAWENGNTEDYSWMRFPGPLQRHELRRRLPASLPKGELARILTLTRWVHRRFEHDARAKPSRTDPLTILDKARSKSRFTCQEYAILLASSLQAIAVPARVVALLKPQYHCGHGRGHWVVEAWSNTLDKWILLDPQNNCHWRCCSTVLNAFEARQLIRDGRLRSLQPYRGGRPAPELRDWVQHFDTIWIYKQQDFFRKWDSLGEVLEVGDKPQVMFQNQPRCRFEVCRDSSLAYPRLNQVAFSLSANSRSASFRLRQSAPFFKSFQRSVNCGPWIGCGDKIYFSVRPGGNTFAFRVLDTGNRPGRVALCSLNVRK